MTTDNSASANPPTEHAAPAAPVHPNQTLAHMPSHPVAPVPTKPAVAPVRPAMPARPAPPVNQRAAPSLAPRPVGLTVNNGRSVVVYRYVGAVAPALPSWQTGHPGTVITDAATLAALNLLAGVTA